MKPFFQICAASFAAASMPLSAQSNPYRGLWVGEVLLGQVNEVTVPLDAANIPRAPDPKVPTPTFDAANLRLIIHVDAAGRARLLKHVAILARKAEGQETENDLALVTDERLYGSFPPQPASRISSVVFDFGDAKATAAVNQVVERAATAAATAAGATGATKTTVKSAAKSAGQTVIAEADAEARFVAFQTQLKAAMATILAGGDISALDTAAENLKTQSFYQDARGEQMLADILAALDALDALPGTATAAQREKVAMNTAAAHAETDDGYERFLAGELFGDAILAAAEAAAARAGSIPLADITGFQSADAGAAVAVISPAHGLTSAEVAIRGAAISAYNGLRTVTRIDDDSFRIAVPHVAGAPVTGYSAMQGIAPLRISSPGHGLSDGDSVSIRGSLAAYNGIHRVTVIDADRFSIPVAYVSAPDPLGDWAGQFGAIGGYESTPDGTAGVKIISTNHGLDNGDRITIRGSGSESYNGTGKVVTRIDANSFSIPQAFAGNPPEKGSWELPVAISGIQPPEILPTRVASVGHRLSSGDRVLIAGSGNAGYNAEFTVTVVDADSFTIPLPYEAATGNPAVKGGWQPAAGGQWRPVKAVRDAVAENAEVSQGQTVANATKVSGYADTRSADAFKWVMDAIVAAAVRSDSPLALEVSALASEAGRAALVDSVVRYQVPPADPTVIQSTIPSADYTAFVRSATFAGGPELAAEAAAAAALKEKANLISTPGSIRDKALQAAIQAMGPVFATASRSLLTELPMSGSFGSSALFTEIVLPANHPTNPFRHRRHPDHTVGFDIRRQVTLGFLPGESRPSGRSGYGVDRIEGTYDEEIFGLHKLLGPERDTGLKVRGSFQLNRISKIDTLNGR